MVTLLPESAVAHHRDVLGEEVLAYDFDFEIRIDREAPHRKGFRTGSAADDLIEAAEYQLEILVDAQANRVAERGVFIHARENLSLRTVPKSCTVIVMRLGAPGSGNGSKSPAAPTRVM